MTMVNERRCPVCGELLPDSTAAHRVCFNCAPLVKDLANAGYDLAIATARARLKAKMPVVFGLMQTLWTAATQPPEEPHRE